MPILEADHIQMTYAVDSRRIKVLDDISIRVEQGEFVVVVGNSGSGKTTLLSILSGLDRPTEGRVFIMGRDITVLNEDEMAPLRNETIGFVFQSFHLVPSLTALENIMFPAQLRKDPDAEGKARVLLSRVGLENRAMNLPSQLSGGEKQRVAVCRALINRPPLVFADEPTGNLDSRNGETLMALLREFQLQMETTLVVVTHSEEIARQADRVLRLRDGALEATS
jgi:putative ABC transport system ATP-binding protein